MRKPPALLLVEDDPVSREFLRAALEALPADVAAAADVDGAQRLAQAQDFDLWLFDVHLGTERGEALLARLRSQGLTTPALALTADTRAEAAATLREQGFADVLHKPLTARSLRERVGHWLNGADAEAAPVWNEDSALAVAGGNPDTVRKLRQLFVQELPAQLGELRTARRSGDESTLRAQLHRLKASCGFVGAHRLLEATRTLHAAPASDAAWDAFEAASGEILGPVEAGAIHGRG